MAAKKADEAVRVADEPVLAPPNARDIPLAAATSVLVFPPGFELQYERHLALTRALKVAGVYPALKVYGLAAQAPDPPAPRLILMTGSAAETQRLAEAFYTREAEAFVARECGNDWNAINPAASVSNLAEQGLPVDKRSFDAVMAELRSGRYLVTVELP